MGAYEEHAERYYVKAGRPTSEPDNIRQALAPVRERYHDIDAREFGPLALKDVRQAMIERDWCRTFINCQVNRIKQMFNWAAEEELVPIGTYQALATVAGLRRGRTEAREKPPVRPVTDSAVEQVLPHLSRTVATMVQLQRLAGMRPQEIVLMRAEDIDRSDAKLLGLPATAAQVRAPRAGTAGLPRPTCPGTPASVPERDANRLPV